MSINIFYRFLLVIVLAIGLLSPIEAARASQAQPAPAGSVTAYDLILAMNTLRVALGNPPLVEDPIINAVAQNTAQIMANNQMSWHIGDVRGRLAAAGYGGGATVWATENFAAGSMSIDQIMAVWDDPDHRRPAETAAYCHVGAGIATAHGKTYYVLQAAYISGQACGSYIPGTGSAPPGGGAGAGSGAIGFIVPVKRATPDESGRVYHVVQSGQSFWAIAIAYQITIADLEKWNNLSRERPLRTGQRLFIPGENTEGYATPTPRGMIVPSPPDADGRIVHEVEAYHTLSTISRAYGVTIQRILLLNGIQQDWPLRIGQKLLIDPGHVTPSPTLSAIQRLTPEADGKYYHTVRSGQTLSWIASYYDIPLNSLMSWNGLNANSVIQPEQKLLLMVTPPATATSTPAPPTQTPFPTPTITPSQAPPPVLDEEPLEEPDANFGLVLWAVLLAIGGLTWFGFSRMKSQNGEK
jgi:LysM repeat protein